MQDRPDRVNEETIKAKAAEGGFDISGATIVDPETSDRTQAYIDKFVELRAKKGMTPEKAKEILHTQYPYYGVMMVKMGDADGMVSVHAILQQIHFVRVCRS